jgi:hypothetical protein
VAVAILDLPSSELRALDGELVRLVRGRQRERYALGLELAALGLRYRELGFRTFGMYVKERVSQSARWCGDARTLARRLEARPALREAFLKGEINGSQAELLARGSTPEDEAERLEAARGLSVRALRDALRTEASGSSPPDDAHEPRVTLDLPAATMLEGMALEVTRMGIQHMNGGDAESWFECLLAEGISSLPEVLGADDAFDPEAMREARRRLRAARAEQLARWEAQATPRAPEVEPPPVELEALEPLEALAERSPNALDARIVQRSARIASSDVWLGKLLDRFFRARGWEALGYVSEQHYCDQRLGIARSTARGRVTLARKLRWLEGLESALRAGELGYEHAALVSRVATPDTLAAWIARAKVRTHKHLREEVRACELVASLHGEARVTDPPPGDEELAVVFDLEAAVLRGEVFVEAFAAAEDLEAARQGGVPAARSARMSVSSEEAPAPPVPMSVSSEEAPAPPVPMSVGFGRRPRVQVRVRESTALLYRQLEQVWKRRGLPGTFWGFCVGVYWRAWGPLFQVGTSAKAVFDRDRHRCVCPVCESRKCTNHHVRYRAHGGSDDLENQITVCEFCHLEGEHGGRLRVRGEASRLTWLLGRVPILRVEGRTKTAA